MKCKNCSFENIIGTNYCQNCGAKLKKKHFFQFSNTKYIAGMGHKGSSIAPLGVMSIENQTKDLGEHVLQKHLVKVCPRNDGSWFCPDCGELNPKYSQFCKRCGRDFL